MRKFIIFFLSLLLFSSSAMAFKEKNMPDNYPMCFDSDVDTQTFCPLNGKLGHKLYLVDFTSRWNQAQVDWIKGRIFGKIIEENVEAPKIKDIITSSEIYIPLIVFSCLVLVTISLRKLFYKK